MKRILLLFLFAGTFFMMKAQTYYDQQWKKIEDNYKKGLYKSNLPIILEIQERAKKEDNAVQLIKSLKAEFSIVNQTQDDTQNDAASQFFAKLKPLESELKGQQKYVYKVLLGQYFTQFYEMNSWQINQRTNISSQDFSQIETWSRLDFKNFISKHYEDLEKENPTLKNIQLSQYKEIFSQTENLDYFLTLFDYKAMNEIAFLQNAEIFTPNELKVNHVKINSIYDELIQKNSGNSKLYFSHQKIKYNCGFTNCKDRLEQLEKLVENNSIDGDYKVEIIADVINLLVEKKEYKKALIWANDAKEKYPKSKFINNIKNAENGIKNPSLTIHYETETQSNKPIHVVAEHKNVTDFSLNIYEVKDDLQGFMKYVSDYYNKNYFKEVSKTWVRKEKYPLENKNDFKTYKTSLEIAPLPSGIYLVEYVVENSVQEYFYFIASENRVIVQQNNQFNSKENVNRLVNRENGKALTNGNMELFEFVRGSTLNKSNVKTDGTGNFTFPKSSDNNYYRSYLIKSPGNNFTLQNAHGRDYYPQNNQSKKMTQIFLDRAIYRPGQTVYFKVINTQFQNEKESVIAGLKQTIKMFDANGEEVAAQNFTTNDFGSYNGNFVLPKGKLNGSFSLNIDNGENGGYKNFQVEEYKRPKFEVTFDPVEGEYKYGQTLELKGKAVMFSGVPLSNATVNYEIKKRNIRWMYFWWYPRGNDNENSILGSVKTNDKGEFTIKVDLEKDETLDGIQIDNYEIEASVTDINGETQSATENVKVASVSHYIKAEEIGNTFADEKVELKVETKNYNEQNLEKSYRVKLSKLEEPKRIIRDNFKSQIQDLPKFSKAEFVQKFPHDWYDKNDDIKNWNIQKVISQLETRNSNLDLGKLEPGNYRLELYNIEGKDTIKAEQYFQVWDKRFLLDTQKPFLEVVPEKTEYQRPKKALSLGEGLGEDKAKIYVYSAIPDALVNVFIQNGNGETKTETLPIRNGVLVYETLIPKDESIVQLNTQFQVVAFNDVQTKALDLKIKNEDKSLKIETITFRDKIEPNSKEKWSVKILGAEKEQINAEVLANMYDMSLDQFAVNSYGWNSLNIKPYFMVGYDLGSRLNNIAFRKRFEYLQRYYIQNPQFQWFDGRILQQALRSQIEGVDLSMGSGTPGSSSDSIKIQEIQEVAYKKVQKVSVSAAIAISSNANLKYDEDGVLDKEDENNPEKIPVRQNLNETAFFYPNLLTDKDGNVSFEFTSPEALTQWKLMFLAHTKDAKAATLEKEVVTQKEFSVTPNYPRFLREGDELNLQSKLSNLTSQNLSGNARLQILDAFTNEDISSRFNLQQIQKSFQLNAEGNSVVDWKIKVPNDVQSIILKIVATSTSLSGQGSFSDGEQKAIAILPNRMLVTDAVPVFVKEGQTKTFVLENLKNSTSKTITNVANTLELTTNPIWEIMFALPSLKNDQNNSADVVFNKWFADVLASEIFKANPKLKTVFEEYQSKGLLTSNLEKNQELKQLLLEETPWVLESKNETEQMAKLARLFDANTMRNSINQDWSDLVKLQNPDGGFSWYSGYPSSYHTSLYILKNLGRINEWLKGNVSDYQSSEQKQMVQKLVNYVDGEVNKYWKTEKDQVWNNDVLDYLDTRHYWETQYPLKGKGANLKKTVIEKAPKAKITDFTFFGLHRTAMLFNHYQLTSLSQKLMTYLKEASTESETQGIYWKQNLNDWGWYSSKTVNHAGALEAFEKLTNDEKFIEEMKIWLVTQKEVNSWGSSRGTAEVIFTILNSGKSWTSNDSDKAEISWDSKEIGVESAPSPLERVGVRNTNGYFKKSVFTNKIDKNLATVTIKKDSPGIVQGGLFWQYYEDLDKIKSSESYISIAKELYRKIKTENGEELKKITSSTPLKVGDKVTVRMILNTDRNMEFIHLKDMRAAGFEPLNVISGYEWKNNLGYYQSTKDASTNFYIQYMPKGKYVFEYDYVCNASGIFSNGITTLQNYYAPQMNAHTKGDQVEIKE